MSLQEKQPPKKPNAECLFLSPEIFISFLSGGDGIFPILVPDTGSGSDGGHISPCLCPRSLLAASMLLGEGDVDVFVGEGP